MAGQAGTLSRRAAALYRSSRFDEAREVYRSLLSLHPGRADDWLNFGLLLRREGDFSGALDAYAKAVDQGIARPEEVHLNRAVVLADDLADPAGARAALETALECNPRYVAALLNLGNLHEDAGELDEARAAYAQALVLEPANALALMRCAEVSRFDRADDPLILQIRSALENENLPTLAKADLGYALGRALDQAGEYSGAFAAYDAANASSRSLAASPYDPAAAQAFVDHIIGAFSTVPTDTASDGDAPIFICGMFRSGSTLVERVISAHSQITAGGELPILPAIVRERLQPYPSSLEGAEGDVFLDIRHQYLKGVERLGLRVGGLTDKRPDNFLHVGLIKRMFPRAKVVLTRRNPLDNCLSVFFAHLDPALTYASSLEGAAHWYGQYERIADHWQNLYPGDVHVADYDALVADPKPAIQALLGFLGLQWEESCLAPHAGSGQVRTASAWQVREPLYARSSGRWRNYADQLEALYKAFGRPD